MIDGWYRRSLRKPSCGADYYFSICVIRRYCRIMLYAMTQFIWCVRRVCCAIYFRLPQAVKNSLRWLQMTSFITYDCHYVRQGIILCIFDMLIVPDFWMSPHTGYVVADANSPLSRRCALQFSPRIKFLIIFSSRCRYAQSFYIAAFDIMSPIFIMLYISYDITGRYGFQRACSPISFAGRHYRISQRGALIFAELFSAVFILRLMPPGPSAALLWISTEIYAALLSFILHRRRQYRRFL